jgi:hypothetical protein
MERKGELRPGIEGLIGFSDKTCSRSGVDEMFKTLPAEDRERCGDAVQNAFDVDVDHVLPLLNAQVVEGATGQCRHC